jgi:hypothetical protein
MSALRMAAGATGAFEGSAAAAASAGGEDFSAAGCCDLGCEHFQQESKLLGLSSRQVGHDHSSPEVAARSNSAMRVRARSTSSAFRTSTVTVASAMGSAPRNATNDVPFIRQGISWASSRSHTNCAEASSGAE